jgi:hypothetical protein
MGAAGHGFATHLDHSYSGTQHGEPEGASVRGGMRNGFVDAREREFRDADVIE